MNKSQAAQRPPAQTIAFIGAGNMAGSVIRGMLAQGYAADFIRAAAPSDNNLTELRRLGVHTTHNNSEAARDAAIIVLGVKPQKMRETCNSLSGSLLPNTLIISLAAGIPCERLSQWLNGEYAIVRCMPNTPSQIQLGACGLYANGDVTDTQKYTAHSIMQSVGVACWVDNEALIDVVTAVAGSGPAYYFLFMEAMIEAACAQGLDRATATELTLQTALGATTLANRSDEPLTELRRRVTSPKGTTEHAITAFEHTGLRDSVANAMEACRRRAQELAAIED